LRDTLAAAAYVALIVLGLAMLNLVGVHRAVAQVMAALFGVGAIFSALGDVAYLANAEYWRLGDWSGLSSTSMIAAGRDTYAVFALSQIFGNGGFLMLAVALFCLGRLCAPRGPFPRYLRYLAYAESGLLILAVIASESKLGIVFNIIGLVSALLVPTILIVIARQFERTRA
jgi:tetrahydromethanopterin S-methyltransferase subunit E